MLGFWWVRSAQEAWQRVETLVQCPISDQLHPSTPCKPWTLAAKGLRAVPLGTVLASPAGFLITGKAFPAHTLLLDAKMTNCVFLPISSWLRFLFLIIYMAGGRGRVFFFFLTKKCEIFPGSWEKGNSAIILLMRKFPNCQWQFGGIGFLGRVCFHIPVALNFIFGVFEWGEPNLVQKATRKIQVLAFICTALSGCSQTEKIRQRPCRGDRSGITRVLSSLPGLAMALWGPPVHQEIKAHQRHTFGSQRSNPPSLC